jgi:hypothetical protein
MLAVSVFADRCAFRAVRAEVDRRIEHRLLADPDAVLHRGVDRATDRAVRAHRALHLDLAAGLFLRCRRFADHVERQLRSHCAGARRDTGALEERAAIHGLRHRAAQASREPRLRSDATVHFSR